MKDRFQENKNNIFKECLRTHGEVLDRTRSECEDKTLAICKALCLALENGNKLILFGNGGSAVDAQHLATELTVRFERNRRAIPAIALTTDTSALTAIGNDFGFEELFARQVEALSLSGDVVIGLSTSGNSENVIRGLKKAREIGAVTVAFTGGTGGRMVEHADFAIVIPSDNTARIQEMHMLIGHILCGVIEEEFCEEYEGTSKH